MRKNGSPDPVFESDEDRTWFLVRLPIHERVCPEPSEQGAEQVTPQVTPQDTGHVTQLVAALTGEMSRTQLQAALKLRDRNHFIAAYLQPALEAGLVEMTLPDKPTSRNQRYRRTGGRACPGTTNHGRGHCYMNTAPIVSKVWSFCTTLRDDGIGYGDYLEQLTWLIFLKMAIVANTRRLCLMNMFLHNIGEIEGGAPISPNDSLVADAGKRFDYILANPPFGKKSSMSFTNEEGEQEKDDLTYNRQDFWATTSNKQLNFVQHIRTMLKTTGRAAVVVPDNVLFEGGAGETIRQKLLDNTDLHTILRLPTGVFYAQGVKANVIFFDNHEASPNPWTKQVWYYDYRTNIHHTLKKKPMRYENLLDFVNCYNPLNRRQRKATWDETDSPEGRWRSYSYEEIKARDKTSLDIFWLKDQSLTDLDNLPEPDVLAEDIIENLEAGLSSFREALARLRQNG